MRLVLVALLLLSGTSGAAPSGTDAVSLRKGGEVIALPGPAQKAIADQVRELASTCNFNSVKHSRLFERRDARAEWSEVASQSHLHVRYRAPFSVPAGSEDAIVASEVLIGLTAENFIGPELTRHGETVALHVKCSGHRALQLMCMPELAPHLPAAYRRNCHLLTR